MAKNKKKKNGRLIGRIIIIVLELVLLTILAGGYYVIRQWDKIEHVPTTNASGDLLIVENTDIDSSYAEEMKKGYLNLAVMGVDGDGYNADVIMLISVNEDNGEIRLVSVYRDTMAMMPYTTRMSFDKINQAMTHADSGSNDTAMYGINMMNALNRNYDLALEDYVKVNWYAVALLIEAVGGVEVEVTDQMMAEINGYITDTVTHINENGVNVGTGAYGLGSVQLTHSGYQHLDGVQTVAYCRLRHYVGGDTSRTERQRQVITQVLQKAKTLSLDQLLNIANIVFPQVQTTLTLPNVVSMLGDISKYNVSATKGFPFYYASDSNYDMYCTDLVNNVSQLHEFLYGVTGYVPSSTVQAISQEMTNRTGLGAVETTPFAE